jgi:ribosomal protein S18 acetylase RimI-like enzyme
VDLRELGLTELGRIREIDRSEHADAVYVVDDGGLRRVVRMLELPTWTEAELAETMQRLSGSVAAGGVFLGVLDGTALVAAAMLGGELLAGEPERLELVFLHVSRTHRRRGLARQLFGEVCRRARAAGAEQLYISSSDVEPAVRFYLGQGCQLAERVDPGLVERWPTDVQLTLAL